MRLHTKKFRKASKRRLRKGLPQRLGEALRTAYLGKAYTAKAKGEPHKAFSTLGKDKVKSLSWCHVAAV